ncbi:MAG: hypothetical protein Q4G13_05360 [Moraxella sp.]|nr:hypothetical protein [Moraxella sp.]
MAIWQTRLLMAMMALVLFVVFCVVQIPAAWLVAKYAPNAPFMQVSGNVWAGQGIWRFGHDKPLTGELEWQLSLLGAVQGVPFDVQLGQGDSRLTGQAGVSKTGFAIKALNGRITPSTMQAFGDVYSEMPIVVKNSYIAKDGDKLSADLQATIGAGRLFYVYQGQAGETMLPMMTASVKNDGDSGDGVLLSVVGDTGEFVQGGLSVTQVQIGLTQRFMQNFSAYTGQADADTVVINYAKAW